MLRAALRGDSDLRGCIIFMGTAIAALGFWLFNKDHAALGFIIMSVCWSWSPAGYFDKATREVNDLS